VDKPAVRYVEVWEKKVVSEPYIKQVEVQKFRTVKVPTTRLEQTGGVKNVASVNNTVVHEETVETQTKKGYKMVEVEEMVNTLTGESRIISQRDLPPMQ
jgi:hypothetical protein